LVDIEQLRGLELDAADDSGYVLIAIAFVVAVTTAWKKIDRQQRGQ
jgi:hypothetical protein